MFNSGRVINLTFALSPNRLNNSVPVFSIVLFVVLLYSVPFDIIFVKYARLLPLLDAEYLNFISPKL